jgi:predicted metal-dependent hydrolase
VAGSRLFNRREFYAGHDEWEEVWRRASGPRRELLHGLIQVAVGYEHCKRGNLRGMASLLRSGARRLGRFTRRPGVREIRQRALNDAARAESEPGLTVSGVGPPKLLLVLEGRDARGPQDAIRIRIAKA